MSGANSSPVTISSLCSARSRISGFLLLAWLPACGSAADDAPAPLAVDLLLVNGAVFAGGPDDAIAAADVGIRGDRIVFVGDADARPVTAAERIDAGGLLVAPGFIDPHTHSLSDLLSQDKNSNLNYLMQGVTTVFNGNDGGGPVDVAAMADRLAANGIGTNTALFIGHGSLREAVMGGENRAPSERELAAMAALVATAMRSGALGLSTGLYYAPGNFAATEEVIALATVAAKLGGVYDSHLRDESSYSIGLLGAIEEALEIGREADIPVNIAHIKALGVDVWGQSAEAIELIEAARARGQRVTADQYPWRASGTHLRNTLVPKAVLAGVGDAYLSRLRDPAVLRQIRPAMAENLRRRGGADSLLIVMANDEDLVGRTLREIAESRGKSPLDCAVDIMLAGATRVASFNMEQQDIDAFMRQPWVMTSSDGTDGHPRKFASFAKKYRDYVVERRVLSIEEFLYRSSGLTADTFGLHDRGRIAEGYAADLVILDRNEFSPKATFAAWNNLSTGVVHSLVNGRIAIRDGRYAGTLPGRVLLKKEARP